MEKKNKERKQNKKFMLRTENYYLPKLTKYKNNKT